MIVKGILKKGAYYDSVSLMIVSKELNQLEGIKDSSVVMGTQENRAILNAAGLMVSDFDIANDTDLLISIKAISEEAISNAFAKVDQLLKDIRNKHDETGDVKAHSLDQAVKQLSGANLSLISIAGKYAAREAMKALKQGLHVMLFSDNVSISEEIELKQFAQSKGLMVMGPDCGTAIINGIPLAFANVVQKGNIGIVAASGTGLQEVSSLISNEGAGISQAIGTGGRDVKKEVGGIMFIEAMKALAQDDETKIIVLISKPPHEEVLQKISDEIKKIKKPVIAILIGGNPKPLRNAGAIPAHNLEEAAIYAASLSKGMEVEKALNKIELRDIEILAQSEKLAKNCSGKYIRGLFSGGTLCDETQLILKDTIGYVYSNAPLNPDYQLKNLWKSEGNTILDMGEDEFTSGRPHPMIDFSLRNKRIIEEAENKEVAIILLDVVLGYGSHLDPASELVPAISKALEISPKLLFICSVTGTNQDPQNRKEVIRKLEKAGALVMPSNVAASKLVGAIAKLIS